MFLIYFLKGHNGFHRNKLFGKPQAGNKPYINWLLWSTLKHIVPWSFVWTSLTLGPYLCPRANIFQYCPQTPVNIGGLLHGRVTQTYHTCVLHRFIDGTYCTDVLHWRINGFFLTQYFCFVWLFGLLFFFVVDFIILYCLLQYTTKNYLYAKQNYCVICTYFSKARDPTGGELKNNNGN